MARHTGPCARFAKNGYLLIIGYVSPRDNLVTNFISTILHGLTDCRCRSSPCWDRGALEVELRGTHAHETGIEQGRRAIRSEQPGRGPEPSVRRTAALVQSSPASPRRGKLGIPAGHDPRLLPTTAAIDGTSALPRPGACAANAAVRRGHPAHRLCLLSPCRLYHIQLPSCRPFLP